MSIVRKTFDDSNAMKSILTLNHIKYELRDVYVYEEFKFELKKRMNGEMVIPSLFVGGVFYGDLNAIQLMNEIGTLTFNLINFIDRQSNNSLCPCCGGANFIPVRNSDLTKFTLCFKLYFKLYFSVQNVLDLRNLQFVILLVIQLHCDVQIAILLVSLNACCVLIKIYLIDYDV